MSATASRHAAPLPKSGEETSSQENSFTATIDMPFPLQRVLYLAVGELQSPQRPLCFCPATPFPVASPTAPCAAPAPYGSLGFTPLRQAAALPCTCPCGIRLSRSVITSNTYNYMSAYIICQEIFAKRYLLLYIFVERISSERKGTEHGAWQAYWGTGATTT